MKFETISLERGDLSLAVPNEITRWRVETFWEKEPETLRWIDGFKSSDLFMDIGANIGIYSLYAAYSKGLEVIAFEPESLNYALLNTNIHTNHMSKLIKAYGLALSDEVSLGTIFLSEFQQGSACHNFKESIDFKHEEFVPHFEQGCFSVTLDYLLENKFISVPQHIKIDVDGIEHKILKGACILLRNPFLESILVELNTNLTLHQEIIGFLKEFGFDYSHNHVENQMCREGPFKGIANYIFSRSALFTRDNNIH